MVRSLISWILTWASTPYGPWALFFLSFAESSFFFIPPDFLLITLALSNPSAAITLAVITTIGSILGGMLGYFIGLKEGRPIEVGSYDVMLKVVDNNGCLSSDQLKVTVKEGPNVLRLKNGWQGYTGNALCRMWQGDPERNYYPPPEASGWVGRYGGVNRQAVSFDDLFDIISSIPASNNITRAELRLYQTANGSFQGQYGNIQIFALAIPFDPAAVCWNTPWTTPGGYDGGTPLRAVDMSDGQKDLWREWEITSYVQEIRNGTRPDYGFLLKQEDEGVDEVNSWYGHHHYDEALRPELVIHFASPIEADTTAPVISDIVVSNISNY